MDRRYKGYSVYVYYGNEFIINLVNDSKNINEIEINICDISREKFLCLLSESVELIESK